MHSHEGKSPTLSVVATSRNDNHGGHLVERMQWFVDGLAWNCERAGIDAELVLVEWNPPEHEPGLATILRWPTAESRLTIRVLTVPRSEHERLLPDGGIPMLQMLAKNVGIRRATGDNVLATNIDILLTPELFDAAAASYAPETVLRAERHDVAFPFPENVLTVEQALNYCLAHPIRYERKDGIHYPGEGRVLPIYQGLGDFLGWNLQRAVTRRQKADRKQVPVPRPLRHRPANVRSVRSIWQFAADRSQALVDLLTLPKLFVNACGDFTMLARLDWLRVRGYPEMLVHSMHLDTVFMHQVDAYGFRFVALEPPAVAYHMEHSAGSGWTPEGQDRYRARVEQLGMPGIGSAELRATKRSLIRARKAHAQVLYNSEDWGLLNAQVAEVRPV